MIGFDTNVLQVRQFIQVNCSAENPGFVGSVVLAETVWVLESAYGMNRNDVALALERLLAVPQLLLQDHSRIRAALDAFGKAPVGFTDLLIAEINRANGCDTTATFDRKAAKLRGFTLVR
jgi:predicted nucleic-acid-binding protein